MSDVAISAGEAMKTLTLAVRMTGAKSASLRMKAGAALLRMVAAVIGSRITVEIVVRPDGLTWQDWEKGARK